MSKKVAELANKLWNDASFSREAMKDLKAGVIEGNSIEVQQSTDATVKPPVDIGAAKCGAGASCTNYGTICSGTSIS